MELTIAGVQFSLYNQVSLAMKYDSVSDLFSIKVYFDPTNKQQKTIFRPGTYPTCKITHGGVLILTGTVLNYKFSSAGNPPKQLVTLSGYSWTGILDDNNMSAFVDSKPGAISTQFNNLTLPQIAKQMCDGLNLQLAPLAADLQSDTALNVPYPKVNIEQSMTMADFLNELCKNKNVVLSHDAQGRLVIAREKVNNIVTTSTTFVRIDQVPRSPQIAGAPSFTASKTTTSTKPRGVLYNFKDNDPAILKTQRPDGSWTGMDLDYNGQQLHTYIEVVGEQSGTDKEGNVEPKANTLQAFVQNPFVNFTYTDKGFKGYHRYRREIQKSGDDNDTKLTAQSVLKDELKNIVLTIDIQGWTLGGNLVIPNQLVTVYNPELYLYSSQKWFIQEVVFYGDEKVEMATLTCVMPQCFGDLEIKNTYF